LDDAQAADFVLECVASAFAAGQSSGEDHSVVGKGGVWDAMGSNGIEQIGDDDGAGDAGARGDRECVAGVVVNPIEDLDVGEVGEPPVGEVGLPAFVGLFGGESDVGAFGAFVRRGDDQAGRA
jgi:hypothetical protein